MEFEWEELGPGATELDLFRVERHLGWALPSDYRDFVKRFSGSVLARPYSMVPNSSLDHEDIAADETHLRDFNWVDGPMNFFIQQCDYEGFVEASDRLLVNRSGACFVYSMDYQIEQEDDDGYEPTDYNPLPGLFFAARTFTDFLNRLEPF